MLARGGQRPGEWRRTNISQVPTWLVGVWGCWILGPRGEKSLGPQVTECSGLEQDEVPGEREEKAGLRVKA